MISALIVISALILGIHGGPQNTATDPELIARAKVMLDRINREKGDWVNKRMLAAWSYQTNLTEENLENHGKVSGEFAKWENRIQAEINAFPWHEIDDYDIKRQFQILSIPGASALSPEKYTEYQELIHWMVGNVSATKICDFRNSSKCDLTMSEVMKIMMKSHDPDELKHVWSAWRNATKKVKNDFLQYVALGNEAARLNGYANMGALWKSFYETDHFTEEIERLWQQLRPLYLQIHAYVRHALREKYGENVVPKDGPIPAHLLGSMSAGTWMKVSDFITPYPGKKLPDVTDAMVEKNFNATMIYKVAEDFFTSINLSAMPDTFWKNSILEKPDDVEFDCQASAWDFFDGEDCRIKACTKINMDNLLIAHHEMGHIQYYLQYKNQPAVYRIGANPGFHEAVGDTIALSATTPEHLKEIGLLENAETDREAELNHLYLNALNQITFLPFAYTVEEWRWALFQSFLLPETYNCQWWNIAQELQGIAPPVERTENDFDPGTIYHIIGDVEYIRYFVGPVIQFQFHKALCIEAGQYDPANPTGKLLSQCNIYRSAKAGNLLRSMLELGSSRPWQDAMEKITGQRNMDASALLEYFKPLQDWLEVDNIKNGAVLGWDTSRQYCAGLY